MNAVRAPWSRTPEKPSERCRGLYQEFGDLDSDTVGAVLLRVPSTLGDYRYYEYIDVVDPAAYRGYGWQLRAETAVVQHGGKSHLTLWIELLRRTRLSCSLCGKTTRNHRSHADPRNQWWMTAASSS